MRSAQLAVRREGVDALPVPQHGGVDHPQLAAARVVDALLEWHGNQRSDIFLQVLVCPVRCAVHFKDRTLARHLGGGDIDDIIFVVAAHDLPPLAGLAFLEELQAFQGTRSAVDQVTGKDDPVRFPAVDVLQGSLEGNLARMDIRQHRNLHLRREPSRSAGQGDIPVPSRA